MTKYQGHRSWNAWNVSLYIANEYGLYSAAVDAFKTSKTRREAQRKWREATSIGPSDKTPDGAVYNGLCVMLALEGLELELGRA